MGGNRWTPDEVETLKREQNMTNAQISEMLPRHTNGSVKYMASQLKLRNPGPQQPTESICWECRHSNSLECSWFNDFTPINGWKLSENGFVTFCPAHEKNADIEPKNRPKRKLRKHPVPGYDRNRYLAMKAEGLSRAEIARRFGVVERTVTLWSRKERETWKG